MSQVRQLKIRPYARLLTMLGEQLIKNERIALIELIKNSYDADAEWVKVTFQDFGDNYQIKPNSKIIIEDNGVGMTLEIIEKHWLNPATPEKKNRKINNEKTSKGRIIQGEKGIGRFAIFKLGREIDIISKTEKDVQEHILSYNFSRFDDEFLTENGNDKELFLDQLNVVLTSQKPVKITQSELKLGTRKKIRTNQGTIIEIKNLKGSWNEAKVREIYKDLTKLESIFTDNINKDFEVIIYKDDEHQNLQVGFIQKLDFLLNNRSVIKIEKGYFDADNLEYKFLLNGIENSISIYDPLITGLKFFRERFGNAGNELRSRNIECGSFHFGFYVFDFSSKAPPKYKLDKEDKRIIKEHRIYLYRDNIRVYPYGEPEDDWLHIDAYRGTISAGHFLSNDQVVGFVNISQKNNSKLKDKTNREGLIDEGNATEDFITILKSFLTYIRQKPYARYRKDIEKKNEQNIVANGQLQIEFNELKSVVSDNKKALDILEKAENYYKAEKRFLTRRAETTEELAGVGLSVETASHDIMGIMGKVFSNLDGLITDLLSSDEIDKDELLKELQSIRGGMSFIEAQLKDIQLLFKSSKQRRKSIRVKYIIEKVERIYRRLLQKESIEFTIDTLGSPLIAKTTDAVLLQLLLNLFDNAVFWLQQTSKEDKRIEILLDGNKGRMIFSDNGPGVNKDDAPYIFEPFYSGKGDEGRGLGLYIARQLLERNDYSIELAELKSDKILSGANFIVNFFGEDN
jgi:signal transduction histidine kinase